MHSHPIIHSVYLTAWLASLLFFVSRAELNRWIPAWPRVRRLLDSSGAVLLWGHIMVAYWITHQGSHAAAVQHVAERTEQMTGIRSGLGIYANFAVAIAWSAAALWPARHEWSPHVVRAIEVFLWLMFLSACIPFAQPASAVVFTLVAMGVLLSRFVAAVFGPAGGDDTSSERERVD